MSRSKSPTYFVRKSIWCDLYSQLTQTCDYCIRWWQFPCGGVALETSQVGRWMLLGVLWVPEALASCGGGDDTCNMLTLRYISTALSETINYKSINSLAFLRNWRVHDDVTDIKNWLCGSNKLYEWAACVKTCWLCLLVFIWNKSLRSIFYSLKENLERLGSWRVQLGGFAPSRGFQQIRFRFTCLWVVGLWLSQVMSTF